MLGNIHRHTIFSPKTYYVIEIIYDSRTAYRLNVHEVIRLKKTEFGVACILENTSLDKIPSVLKSGKHVALHVRGSVLLEDEIKIEEDQQQAFNLEQHFSFGQVEGYVVSSYINQYYCYVSAVRKEIVQQWITDFNKENIEVFSIYLGLNTLVNYLKGINLTPGIYQWEGETLNWDGDYISSYFGDEQSKSLMDSILEEREKETIESVGLIALSGIVSHYYKIGNPTLQYEEHTIPLKDQEEGYYITNFIKKVSMVVLPILFMGLLVNFFMFSEYSKEANQLNETLSVNEFKWKIYDDLKQKFENNKRVLTRHSRLGSMTYYADQIAHLRPYQVTFSKVDVYPLTEKAMEYNIEENTIFIEGYSANHSQYQAWIKLLKETDWIEALKTVGYKRNVESGLTKFTLKIDIHHE